ncbi:B12-binding domain-containing radical SAM protein [Brotaphodocola sp.]|uniref:B12-binding domain-containing radical SAM protein n=1 Tax=Brotaphodocola sp. TaxID=3073577 RepID=UPI003D7D8A8A
MKILLTAINAKYIHSNLGIYSLKAYGEKILREQFGDRKGFGASDQLVEIELAEYTINQQIGQILQDLYRKKPDIIGFSCYIWNIAYVRELLADVKKVLPDVQIWLGGPEVSYDASKTLRENPVVDLVMKGEGEETFAQLLKNCVREDGDPQNWREIDGLAFRNPDGSGVMETKVRSYMDMSQIPFPYECVDVGELEHRIIYYESSRGCPFSCAYCLSSIDKRVRFRGLDLVKRELAWFLEAKVPQVKFVDRTFNCKKDHAMEIWRFIRDQDNGITNFHFEIAADLLDEDELELLSTMRPGLVQLEIGVQSTNERTLEAIHRKTDIDEIREVTARINSWGRIHQHLDLIAGLPWEDLESFRHSFDDVYRMEPEQLQLGFLKVLKGSCMEEMTQECGLQYASAPPYEVLSTRWLPYGDVLTLKQIEEMVEVYYNSRQFCLTLRELEKEYESPYSMFREMADYYEAHQLFEVNHSRMARYEILWDLLAERFPGKQECFRDLLMCDLYLRENIKSRPSFAPDPGSWKEETRRFFRQEEQNPHYLKHYEGYDSRQMARMAHLERLSDGSYRLFDYKKRDPLSRNAGMIQISDEELME